jgi:glutathione peroxidase
VTKEVPDGKALYTTMASATSFFEFKPKDSTSLVALTSHLPQPLTNCVEKGAPYDLKKLEGKVVLVVNTASKCGFTPQFEGLEKLYKDIKGKHPNDFEIIGFPCNQFGGQDPGSNEEIQDFCQVNYGVSFPVLGKIDVSTKSHPFLARHALCNVKTRTKHLGDERATG